MSDFINLRNFTHLTLQMGIGSVVDHISAAKEVGQKCYALTDKMNIAGLFAGQKEAAKQGMSFVAGCEINFIDRRTNQNKEFPFHRIMVFVKNNTGYVNLCRILGKASTPQYSYYKPRVDWELLCSNKEGLIVTTGDCKSLLGHHIDEMTGEEEQWFLKFKEEFGEDFYAEVCLQDTSERWSKEAGTFVKESNKQASYNERIIELATLHDVKMYLTHPVYIPDPSFYDAQRVMIWNTPGNDGWHFPQALAHKSEEQVNEMRARKHAYISEELYETLKKNTILIADKCKNMRIDLDIHLPKIQHREHPAWQSPEVEQKLSEYTQWAKANDEDMAFVIERAQRDDDLNLLLRIILELGKVDMKDEAVRKRLCKEIKVIHLNGIHKLCDYFLLLDDANRFVFASGELRGFGRGSGAGSLVNYALDITDIDPLHYDLLFERFLSRERIGEFFFEVEE